MKNKLVFKYIRVSEETHLFLISEKYKLNCSSIDILLKKKFLKIKGAGKK